MSGHSFYTIRFGSTGINACQLQWAREAAINFSDWRAHLQVRALVRSYPISQRENYTIRMDDLP
jgi:hypothetical protein